MKTLFFLLALTGAVPTAGGDPAAAPDLAAQFKNPPAHRRVLKIIHNFPEKAEQRADLMEQLLRRGFGGVVANVHFNEYLQSEVRWEEFRAGVDAVRKAGLTLWLYDEQGYPSGAAGGLTLQEHPRWEAKGLLCVVADAKESGETVVPLPEGNLISLKAYPVRNGEGILSEGVDLRDKIGEDGQVHWRQPGPWRICGFLETRLYEGTHAEKNLFRKRPYPNLLQKEPMERFVEITHGAYRRRFQNLNGLFEAIFTDEPSLMSVFLQEMPHAALPWAPGMEEAFQRRKGYALLPVLPALASDFGPQDRKVRCDFWDVVGCELAENYFGRIQDWCRKAGIASTGHLLAEEDLGSHVGFYGNFYSCASRLDIPGIDCLTSVPATVPWHVAKLLGSVACRMGRGKTMSETSDHAQRYRPPGDRRSRRDVTAVEILGTAHLLYSAGINTTTSYYSWAGLKNEDVYRINQQIGRLGVLLEGGNHVCDIALLYPVESVWSHFVPQRLWARSPAVSRIDSIYRDTCYGLFRTRRDFDIIDASALAEARPDGEAIRLGSERYRILILPAVDVLPLPALQRARDLVRIGGVVIAIGEIPLNTPGGFPDPEARAITKDLFGEKILSPERDAGRILIHRRETEGAGVYLPLRSGWLLPAVLDRMLEPDLKAPVNSPLRYTHRKKNGRDVYFIINDSGDSCAETVFTRGEGPAERWDPATGEVSPIEPEADGAYRMALPAYGSTFLSFPGARRPSPKRASSWRLEDLIHAVDLQKAAGRAPLLAVHSPAHVKAEKPISGSPPLPAEIQARIEKGGFDCWCFAELRFPKPADLSPFRALELLTRVSPGQEGSRTRLLAILIEEGEDGTGREYIADAHRSLEEAGLQPSAVPFDSFQLAGWSRDPDGKLDLQRIRAVRIGWGGHIGREGEVISFCIEEMNLLKVD